jgi:hypothetical protein
VEHLLVVLLLVRLDHYSSKINNMATYGRGQMLGSGINPESFKLDYSGMANAAATQAQGVADLGASIGGAISEVGDYFKKQKEDEKKVQKSLSVAKAIGDLIPGLQPTIKGSLDILNDKEIPLSQRTAEADAIADILNLGINEVRNRQDVGFKERALNIQEAEALARNAPKPVVYDFEPVEIPAEYGGKSGVLRADKDLGSGIIRTADGKLYRNEEDAKLQRNPIVQGNIDAGLNTGIPASASEAERKSILINNALEIPDTNNTAEANPILLNDFPDGMPVATETPAPLGAPTMIGTPAIDALPPGFTPTQAEVAEIRALTEPEKQEMKLPDGDYVGRFINGKLTATPTIIPAKTDSIASSRTQAMDAPNIALVQKAQESAQKLPSLEAALDLLDSNEVKTGTFADYKVIAKRFLGQDVSNEEQFNSLVGNLAMEAIDLTKGAISDKEMKYFTEVLAPNIGKSVQGNKNIIEFKINAAKRDIEIAKRVSKLFESNASPSEIQSEVLKMMEKKPLDKGMKNPRIGSIGLTPDEMQFLESRPY